MTPTMDREHTIMMPGMIQRARGTTTTNTRPPSPPTLKPARAKSYKPYPPGTTNSQFHIITVAGGEKGTGQMLARYAYYCNPLHPDNTDPGQDTRFRTRGYNRTDAATIRNLLSAAVEKHGYTIVQWPKELRP